MTSLAAKTTLLAVTVLVLSLDVVLAARSMVPQDKHDYTIEIDNVETNEMAKDVFHEDSLLKTLVNKDGGTVLQANLNMLKDYPSDLMITVAASEMDPRTNKWVKRFGQNRGFCDFLENNTYFADHFYKDTNLPRKCPITAGEYYVNDVVIDNSEFPTHWEESRWRCVATLFDTAANKIYLKFSIYAVVEPLDE